MAKSCFTHKRRPGVEGTGVGIEKNCERLLNSDSPQITQLQNFPITKFLYSPGATCAGAPPATSAELNTGFAPKCAGLAASNCSLR